MNRLATIDEIRAKYPRPENPNAEWKEPGLNYCVLGAACLLIEGRRRQQAPRTKKAEFEPINPFPMAPDAAEWIGISVDAAREILRANDFGEFEKAWLMLADALAATDHQTRWIHGKWNAERIITRALAVSDGSIFTTDRRFILARILKYVEGAQC